MQDRGSSNGLVIFLGFALVAAVIVLLTLVGVVVIRLMDNSANEVVIATAAPPPGVTLAPTLPTSTTVPPHVTLTPQPFPTNPPATPVPGSPTARVTAANGVNVRSGPGTTYPIILVAPRGSTAPVVGRSADSAWWVLALDEAPQQRGWVTATFVDVTGAENVPIIAAPPAPTPRPTETATATSTPAPSATPATSFSASRSQIVAGESSLLSWQVQNVQAVYVYPVGADFLAYGVPGVGSREVRPFVTTSYEMRVVNLDNSNTVQQIVVNVAGGLDSGRWLLQGYSIGAGGLIGVLPGTQLSATFSAGGLSGNGGCNTFNAAYQAYQNVLAIGPVGATQLSCEQPEGIMQQEGAYFNLFALISSFEINAGQLFLRDANGQTLMLFVSG